MNSNNISQVVLLAGGKGTRMRELTELLPKPMVEIGNKPVLVHLMNIFNNFKKFNFLIATGYKHDIIENYFSDFENVKVIETGLETNTGGRLFKLEEFLDENFLLTYGDGLANVRIDKLIQNFEKNNTIGSVTISRPTSRFGLVDFDEKGFVNKFIEKPKLDGYVNIGFFGFKKDILNYLDHDSVLEQQPLRELVLDRQLSVNIHDGYFEPMDTYREYLQLNEYYKNGNIPWMDFS
jgi:glucose-1-phosphate cytidylyltransferase